MPVLLASMAPALNPKLKSCRPGDADLGSARDVRATDCAVVMTLFEINGTINKNRTIALESECNMPTESEVRQVILELESLTKSENLPCHDHATYLEVMNILSIIDSWGNPCNKLAEFKKYTRYVFGEEKLPRSPSTIWYLDYYSKLRGSVVTYYSRCMYVAK
jgi:hypothetical protein